MCVCMHGCVSAPRVPADLSPIKQRASTSVGTKDRETNRDRSVMVDAGSRVNKLCGNQTVFSHTTIQSRGNKPNLYSVDGIAC